MKTHRNLRIISTNNLFTDFFCISTRYAVKLPNNCRKVTLIVQRCCISKKLPIAKIPNYFCFEIEKFQQKTKSRINKLCVRK
ncbi:MAG TPA: hypothetical protein DCQ31_01765 [Bacteroidales bacterium]|nr:hypothetical protein [Bacteroidales bacterium]